MKSLLKIELGRRLKLARKAMGLTQKRLGEILDVEDVTVSRWETGTFAPEGKQFDALCRVLQKTPSYFAGQQAHSAPTVESLSRIIEEQERRIHTLEARLSQANQQVVPAQQTRGGAPELRRGSPPAAIGPDRAELLGLIASPALDDAQVSRTLRNLKTELAAIAGASPHPRARKQSKEPM